MMAIANGRYATEENHSESQGMPMRPAPGSVPVRRLPSQADIAAAAGVSTATVSRVVNNSNLVSEDLRDRVLAEMDRLGYFPHGAARALAANKSWTIGAVIPTIDSDLFARGVDALMKRLREMDYSLMVVSSDYSLDDEARVVQRLLERGVDGLFLVGQERLPQTARLLAQSGRPYVETYISDERDRDNHIGFNNVEASITAMEHLVTLGHRQIGMIAGITRENDRARQRVTGYRSTMAKHGLPVDAQAVVEVVYDIDAARRAFAEMVDAGRMPTALMCGNDLIAHGVLIEARCRGIRVPAELSVVGIDNHPMSRLIEPQLTTIDIPATQIGLRSAEALVNAIENGAEVGRQELEAPLIVRASTAPPIAEAST